MNEQYVFINKMNKVLHRDSTMSIPRYLLCVCEYFSDPGGGLAIVLLFSVCLVFVVWAVLMLARP